MSDDEVFTRARIAESGSTGWNVTGYHASRTHNRVIANGNPRHDKRTAADPDITSDVDGPSELKPPCALCRVAGMVRGHPLNARPNLGEIANGDLDHIEVDARISSYLSDRRKGLPGKHITPK